MIFSRGKKMEIVIIRITFYLKVLLPCYLIYFSRSSGHPSRFECETFARSVKWLISSGFVIFEELTIGLIGNFVADGQPISPNVQQDAVSATTKLYILMTTNLQYEVL